MRKYTLLAILMCFSFLAKAQNSSGKHHIKYLDINSGNPDTGVSFIDEDEVVFTSTASDRVINTEKYNPLLDFYKGTVDENGSIVDKKKLGALPSKKISKNAATFSNDGKTVYFSANKYAKRKKKSRKPLYQLFKAKVDDSGKWSDAEKLPFVNKKYSYSNPTVNKENTRLYFVSDEPSSLGGTDIYYVDIKEDGTYGKPVNVGSKVNTSGNETTPFIADNNFLYYSSDGRSDSMGGMDVYVVEAFENVVSDPLHLASPINSINDDIGYIINKENKGFFSSNRLQGRGNDDIYSFYIEPDKPKECLQEIVGTVRDKDVESLIVEADINVLSDDGTVLKTLKSDYKGNYKFTLSCNQTYTVVASKSHYSKEEHVVNTANYLDAPPLEVNQFLTKELKKTIDNKLVVNINPIYFNFDKSNIRQDAKVELDKIVKIMKENPELQIEAASHTDAIGPKYYNQKLSERRAKSTVRYIVSQGIDASRITAKGYGESQPINDCRDGKRCTIQQHRLNRRTEFVIVNKQVLNLPEDDDTTNTTVATTKVTEKSKDASNEGSIEFIKETTEDITNTSVEDDSEETVEADDDTLDEEPKTDNNDAVLDESALDKTDNQTSYNYTKKLNTDSVKNAEELIDEIAPEVKKKKYHNKQSIVSR